MEQSTAHLNNVANITVDINIIILNKKQNEREEDCKEDRQEDRQEDRNIPFDKNDENKSTISSKTIEPSTSNKIEQIARKTVNASEKIEQNSIKIIKAGTEKHFFPCIDNIIPVPISLTFRLGEILLSKYPHQRQINRQTPTALERKISCCRW